MDLLLKNGMVVLDGGVFLADIGVRAGKIAAVAQPGSGLSAETEVDCTGLHILPGLIDTHAHFWEPGPENYREGYYHGTRCAAAAGVTTVIEMPLSVPPVVDAASHAGKLRAAQESAVVDFALWGALIPASVSQIEQLNELGCVAYKGFMSFANPDYPHVTDDVLYTALEKTAAFDGLVGVHAENAYLADLFGRRMEAAGVTAAERYHEGRPPLVETEAIARVVRLAEAAGSALYICHMCADEGYDITAEAKARGQRVYTETCPHYLLFDNTTMKKKGAFAKCNPPLRPAENREKLWQRVLGGQVDCLGSDHGPYSDEEKMAEPSIWKALAGFAGMWGLLHVMLSEGYHKRGMLLAQIAKVTAGNAARIFGLRHKGCIRPGYDADFCVVDLDADWTFDGLKSFTKLHSSKGIYEDVPLKGQVRATYVRGARVYDGDEITVNAGWGQLVRREV
ncbi:allantoinase AllB [Ruminococcaceae bacterium OttesenSCG-928-D13]|nr:allantoinase AllB [Ruminococcaceae bacterium OttesenSCG-928-D13]